MHVPCWSCEGPESLLWFSDCFNSYSLCERYQINTIRYYYFFCAESVKLPGSFCNTGRRSQCYTLNGVDAMVEAASQKSKWILCQLKDNIKKRRVTSCEVLLEAECPSNCLAFLFVFCTLLLLYELCLVMSSLLFMSCTACTIFCCFWHSAPSMRLLLQSRTDKPFVPPSLLLFYDCTTSLFMKSTSLRFEKHHLNTQ